MHMAHTVGHRTQWATHMPYGVRPCNLQVEVANYLEAKYIANPDFRICRWRWRGAWWSSICRTMLSSCSTLANHEASKLQVEVEKYLEEQDLPYTVFQPQYIYGPYTNKDCEQWFVDRIIRCCLSRSQIHTHA